MYFIFYLNHFREESGVQYLDVVWNLPSLIKKKTRYTILNKMLGAIYPK